MAVDLAQSWFTEGTADYVVNLKVGGVYVLAANDKIDVRPAGYSIALNAGLLSVVRIK